MELKSISKSILLLVLIIVISNCNEQKDYTIGNIHIMMNRNIPVPDDIVYYLEPNEKLINMDSISFVEILDSAGNQLEKIYSFKSPINDSNAIKFRSTKFISEFKDSLSLKKFLLRGKLKVVFKNGEKFIYD